MTIFRSEPYRLPGGFTVAFTLDTTKTSMAAEWVPTAPPPGVRRAGFMRVYRKARTAFLGDVQAATGLRALVIELGGAA